ncbi:metal-sensitive transcriptional regulator [Chromobacterium sphagni]|uniref:Transcriptional regulator n=1 Tax=Chromobacterium sphagni TaxID=1903179 RepID=A0A1S1X0G3_9NEIS|nr:metal-sensitive transcriptional regulator [Chromobacterium sphagni]OHX13023.1 transcriptional regulator [Chromobacterium sphagni]OHX19293.1 transcriptional regulator [Chromobacterium sphagni]
MTDTRHPHDDCCHEPPAGERTVVQPGKAALLKRLARIEGQVRGISGMIDSDRYCVDVLTQVAAVKSAMDAVALQLLENHMKGCVARALQQGDATGMVTELIDVVKKVR